MKKLAKKYVDSWYDTIYDSEKFLNHAEYMNINCFTVENGVRKVLFENGNNYTVDTEMAETDGEKQKEIIEMLQDCGVEFEDDEKKTWIEMGACGTYHNWGIEGKEK